MTAEQRDAVRIALVHLILASSKDPTLEKTIEILRNMINQGEKLEPACVEAGETLRNLLERINNDEQSDQMEIAREIMKQDLECLSNLSMDKKMKFKFILVVTDVTDSNEKTKYFGPFDDGEQALSWGQEHFGSVDYFLMSTTLYDPNELEK